MSKNNSLSNAIAATEKTTKTNSTKNPAFYNRQLRSTERSLMGHENPVVRQAVAECATASTGTLVAQLSLEQDPKVLRAILMHPNLPIKHIKEFANDERIGQFNGDKELEDTLVARIAPTPAN